MSSAAFQTRPVRPSSEPSSYWIASPVEDAGPTEPSELQLGCCTRSLKKGVPKMVSVGAGRGQYIEETTYRLVGEGNGDFMLHDPEPEEQKGCSKLLLILCLLLFVVLAVVACFWLARPEDGSILRTSTSSTTPAPMQRHARITTRPPSVPSRQFVRTDMQVLNLHFHKVANDPDLMKRFITEIQQGTALSCGKGILPQDVIVGLHPDTAMVDAVVCTSTQTSVGALQRKLAAEQFRLEEGVETSVKMMRHIEQAQNGDSIRILVKNITLVDAKDYLAPEGTDPIDGQCKN